MNKNTVGKNKFPNMPTIDGYHSRAEWETACWEKLSASKDLLKMIITSHERHDLVMRAVAIDALVSGKSYRQIGKELWLSSQTISGINKALAGNNYRSYLERSKKERKKKVYSYDKEPRISRPRGTPRRTKYGTLYFP